MQKKIIHLALFYETNWTNYLEFIAKGIYNDFGKTFILKGGTALMFLYGLPRKSTDLDYDTAINNIDINNSLKKYLVEFIHKHFNTDANIIANINSKILESGINNHIHLSTKDQSIHLAYSPLKIDIRFKENSYDYLTKTCVINNICTYEISVLAELKLNSITGTDSSPGRLKFRDFFDANYVEADSQSA
jgi:hypothetical protein